jgi:sulfoxide reductase heme-binding subunit YedZ
MNSNTPIMNKSNNLGVQALKMAAAVILVGLVFIVMLGIIWFTQTTAGASLIQSIQSLFAMDTVQAWWYITRASGLTAYFIMWLSMVWGMAIPTKIFHPSVEGAQSYDFHEFLSLLGLGFLFLHITVLMFDQYLPFSVWQILIPFSDSYRPFWVGLGIIGAYIFILVTATFYMRRIIGSKAFRSIHTLSIAGYLGATLHGLFAGTDSALPVTRLIYIGTFLVVLFFTVYWIVMGMISKREQMVAAERAALARRQAQRVRFNQR